ncbi:glycosyltransferase family 9 protein [Zophobihabitans entericus]|uniref:Glycosyltransferase family 9 protein n=1 Tax=Zophobihabitans entericus TaxID=1635327 RepID=A0A6G9IC98_9GAMM|nr:glycosyltransferase family 9 protein [Zophobihabitans entericus]QIQ21210.1 glycosyltransferase family 9 protein [Zophobihabitans entericus]
MSLKQKVRELNWKRNFAVKKLRLVLKFKFYKFITLFFPRRSKDFDLKSCKKVLLIRNDRIGDMVATTSIIRSLANAGYDVYISSRKSSLDILEQNPYIKGSFVYDDSSLIKLFSSIKTIRKERFDIAIEMRFNRFIDFKNLTFCVYTNTTILAGFNKSSIPAFNISIPYYEPNKHVTNQLGLVLDLLNIVRDDMHYELYSNDLQSKNAQNFIDKIKVDDRKIILFNPFGSQEVRCFSNEQLKLVCDIISKYGIVVVIGEKRKLEQISNLVSDDIITFDSASITDIVPLVRLSDMVVSVDTSIVHIASCFKKKTIAFYIDTVPKKPNSNNKKATYNYNLMMSKAKLEDCFQDRLYIINNHPNQSTLVNHNVWSPNSPYAKQIIFDFDPVSTIPLNILETETREAFQEILHENDINLNL